MFASVCNDSIYTFQISAPIMLTKPIIHVWHSCPNTSINVLDFVYKVAMILIGGINASFAFYIFYYRNKADKKKEYENLRRDILNNYVLKYKLPVFYDVFTRFIYLSEELVKNRGDMDDVKIALDDQYQDLFSEIRKDFTEYLGAVDENLYNTTLRSFDNLQSLLSENLFDEDVDLSQKDNYQEFIMDPIKKYQKEILVKIFNFK